MSPKKLNKSKKTSFVLFKKRDFIYIGLVLVVSIGFWFYQKSTDRYVTFSKQLYGDEVKEFNALGLPAPVTKTAGLTKAMMCYRGSLEDRNNDYCFTDFNTKYGDVKPVNDPVAFDALVQAHGWQPTNISLSSYQRDLADSSKINKRITLYYQKSYSPYGSLDLSLERCSKKPDYLEDCPGPELKNDYLPDQYYMVRVGSSVRLHTMSGAWIH